MTYLGILLIGGLLASSILGGITYFDTKRRGLPTSSRLLWLSIVGVVSFFGFLVPHFYESTVGYLYFEVIKGRTVSTHPREWLVVSLTTGILISAGSGVLYTIWSRISHSRTQGKI